nr:MAG TPA: hypothetical protein [Caudoviricetes sp.]DAP51771.1 MAG TPA: hypothetical protein [Caudoviricetes sp.]
MSNTLINKSLLRLFAFIHLHCTILLTKLYERIT